MDILVSHIELPLEQEGNTFHHYKLHREDFGPLSVTPAEMDEYNPGSPGEVAERLARSVEVAGAQRETIIVDPCVIYFGRFQRKAISWDLITAGLGMALRKVGSPVCDGSKVRLVANDYHNAMGSQIPIRPFGLEP